MHNMRFPALLTIISLASLPLFAGPPNIVIFFLDDAGYGDFSPFADIDYPTPNIQKLADDGTTFTNLRIDFHVSPIT